MSQINTISEFLLQAGTEYRVFDMARAIRPIEAQLFLEIESGTVPAPYPRQQHAWFGILFFNKQMSNERYIWFVKLPLDEQGLVIGAARQQFLQIVVEALGQTLDKQNNPNNQLPENPFTFVPNQQQSYIQTRTMVASYKNSPRGTWRRCVRRKVHRSTCNYFNNSLSVFWPHPYLNLWMRPQATVACFWDPAGVLFEAASVSWFMDVASRHRALTVPGSHPLSYG